MVDDPSPGVLVQGSNTMGLTIKDCSSGLAKRQPLRTNTTILGFAEGAMQKRSDLTDDLKNSPKLLCSRFLTYDEWVYCPSSWCKFGRRTLVSAVAKTLPPNRWPEPLNKVTRWTIWCHASQGKSRKLSETEKHHHEDTWLWLKNDSPLRIQNDTYYDICLINMS